MQKLYRITVLETHLRTVTRAVVAESEEAAEAIALGQKDGDCFELSDEFHECTGDKEIDETEHITSEADIVEVLDQWEDILQCIDCGAFGSIMNGTGCECADAEV